ncbi:MAG TPA: nucleoside-triphosphatase [Candidatus Saccharimonadales bacterium]|nr:nucleoside-triphosphatase [Candidatus Saccharimonadales bacterium]
MKILLTGLPKSGKSTMLANLIADVRPKHGLTSPEVRERGERTGFDLCDEAGNIAPLSRVGTVTNYPVGRYYVDLKSLESFIEQLFNYHSDDLLFIDEIGQMQLYSERFKHLVRDYIEAQNDFIGTISQVYDHPFINDLKQNQDILLCVVTPENREHLQAALVEALRHREMFNLLSAAKQHVAFNLARDYLANDQYISLRKLFKNAVPYVVRSKVHSEGDEFTVQGSTGEHHVYINQSNFMCDCDFFNGRGQFVGMAGECSHIQSVNLFLS